MALFYPSELSVALAGVGNKVAEICFFLIQIVVLLMVPDVCAPCYVWALALCAIYFCYLEKRRFTVIHVTDAPQKVNNYSGRL